VAQARYRKRLTVQKMGKTYAVRGGRLKTKYEETTGNCWRVERGRSFTRRGKQDLCDDINKRQSWLIRGSRKTREGGVKY